MPLPADLGAVACLELASALGRFADAAHRAAREMVAAAERLGRFAGAWYVATLREFTWTPPIPPNVFSESFRERIVTQRIPVYAAPSPDAHHVDEHARKQLEEIDAIIAGCST